MRVEWNENGVCVGWVEIDLEAGTMQEVSGDWRSDPRALTADERAMFGPPPLDFNGVAAALNVVLGLWSLEDAANAAGVPEDALVAEALSWKAEREPRE